MDESLGSGWFLKMGKSLNRYLIDPFTLRKDGVKLVADRSSKRLLFMKQDSYNLVDMQVSSLRSLTSFEYTFIATSETNPTIASNLSLATSLCFDIKFNSGSAEKSMTVFGENNEMTESLQFIMATEGAGLSVDSLLGPARPPSKTFPF